MARTCRACGLFNAKVAKILDAKIAKAVKAVALFAFSLCDLCVMKKRTERAAKPIFSHKLIVLT